MNMFSRMPLKSLITGGALALVVSTAFAATWQQCLPTCTQNADNAYNQSKAYYTTAQLKTIQEVITLAVFALFSVFWLKEAVTINHLIGFALIAAGASFIFRS